MAAPTSKRPLAPRVQLPAALTSLQQTQEVRGGAPETGPAAAALAPESVTTLVPNDSNRKPSAPAAVATEDQNAILAKFNLASEAPTEQKSDRCSSTRRFTDENRDPASLVRTSKGKIDASIGDLELLSVRHRHPPEAGRPRRSNSREALRLVADYATPEDGDSWEAAQDGAAGSGAEEEKVYKAPAVDFISKASSFHHVVVEHVEVPTETQLLYPYGIDGPLINYLEGAQKRGERHGDGLMSIKEAKLWPDRLTEMEMEDKAQQDKAAHGQPRFNRQSFTWRQREHRLLGNIIPLGEGSHIAEAVLRWDRVEAYCKIRETEHNLIVVPEVSQCWLIAYLAEKVVPSPPPVYSKKKRGRGWHIAVSNFEPLRKMYILPDPPEDEELREQTISLALSVSKTHDGNAVNFEEAMGAMKNICAWESSNGGWSCGGLTGADMEQSFAPDKEEGGKFQYLTAHPPFVPE